MTARYRRAAGVPWRRVGAEAILAPTWREDFDRLSPTASATWLLLDEPRSAPEIAAELSEVFSAPLPVVLADVERLLVDLQELGVVEDDRDG